VEVVAVLVGGEVGVVVAGIIAEIPKGDKAIKGAAEGIGWPQDNIDLRRNAAEAVIRGESSREVTGFRVGGAGTAGIEAERISTDLAAGVVSSEPSVTVGGSGSILVDEAIGVGAVAISTGGADAGKREGIAPELGWNEEILGTRAALVIELTE